MGLSVCEDHASSSVTPVYHNQHHFHLLFWPKKAKLMKCPKSCCSAASVPPSKEPTLQTATQTRSKDRSHLIALACGLDSISKAPNLRALQTVTTVSWEIPPNCEQLPWVRAGVERNLKNCRVTSLSSRFMTYLGFLGCDSMSNSVSTGFSIMGDLP